jgi:hypothetical protein
MSPYEAKKSSDLKRSMRWKWMAGATAATVGATASQAGLVTVNLVNNYISAQGGNHLNADVTGDGQPDLIIANATNFFFRTFIRTSGGSSRYSLSARAGAYLNGIRARAYIHLTSPHYLSVLLGSQRRTYGTLTLTGSIPIAFKDLHINGGAQTEGSLKVTVSLPIQSRTGIDAKVQLDSLSYNRVPDGGSSLALLALGAGGVVALRRSRTARELF